MIQSAGRQFGMTLVEVVVATVILSMIMLGTATAMRTFGRTYERLLVVTDDTSEMREVHRFLRQAMRNAMGEAVTFNGLANSVSWATPLDRVGSAGGIQYLRLRQQDDGLVLSFAPWDPATISEGDPQWGAVIDDFVLVDELQALSFEYKERADAVWSRAHDGRESPAIPRAVAINITTKADTWPRIVINLAGGGVP